MRKTRLKAFAAYQCHNASRVYHERRTDISLIWFQKAILAKYVKSGRDIFGSDRREIFIAFAQSGYQPTHLIPNLILCALYLKTMLQDKNWCLCIEN
jgi:hypothetical protein